MAGFKRSEFIDKPVEEVFDFATDLSKAYLFMPGVTETEMLTEGGLKPGAKFRETRVMNGKKRSAVIEVVEHKRPQVHAACSAMMGMKAIYRFQFAPENTGTRVDMEAEVTGNWLWKPFLGMMTRFMEKEDGEFLTRLKEAVQKAEADG